MVPFHHIASHYDRFTRLAPTASAWCTRISSKSRVSLASRGALAHRRLTVLFAMIRDGSLYDVPELKIA
ncbi:hypothetical protein FQA45_14845 [Glutamicibacter halophytocola]|uniref:IS110 family transposase n=1 Tax=Glutamicibacter halophytocola TaxID=1933880 RepID=A0ABX5YCU3_9MICC|nr:hypothetical protein FQA45_14845 [Glutamicibacter halophytocola]